MDSIVSIAIRGTILFVVLLCFVIISIRVQVKRKIAHRQELMRRESEREKAVLQARIEEQERIMNLIAGELHDNMGQMLSVIDAHVLQAASDEQDERSEAVGQLKRLTGRLIYDVQNISHLLNAEYIKGRGLTDSLHEELEYIKTIRKVQCLFAIEGAVVPLAPDKELVLFRLAQEAINNAIKHSKARTLLVTLSYEPSRLRLVIEDDGCGFDMAAANGRKGAGLLNMANRAQLLNAALDIRTSQGSGCRIALDLPV
jgi:signal transduction histidine kinase